MQLGAVKEDQARLLLEHKDALSFEAAAMRKGIEAKDVTISLRHALAMLGELRTSSLTPKVSDVLKTRCVICSCSSN
jgi:hypothetical protein